MSADFAYVANRHPQVWRNRSVNETYEFGLVSYKRGHFVSPLKRQPQNAPAAIASSAKKEDFHNGTV
jgi:hypothetical protein